MGEHFTFDNLAELADAGRVCTDDKLRPLLKSVHAALWTAIKAFCSNPTAENLRTVTAAWSHASRIYRTFKEPAPPAPVMGGLSEGAELQRAA